MISSPIPLCSVREADAAFAVSLSRPPTAVKTLKALVAPRIRKPEAIRAELSTAALWASPVLCVQSKVGMSGVVGAQPQVHLFQQHHVLLVVSNHARPRLRIALHASFPQAEVRLNLAALA